MSLPLCWSTLAGEGAQPWLSHLLSARTAQKMLGNLVQALNSMLLELSPTYPLCFSDTSDPGRFLEDKLSLSALPAWFLFFFFGGEGVIYPLIPARSFPKLSCAGVLLRAAPSQLSRRGEPSLGFESRITFSEESKSQSEPLGNMECAAMEMCSLCSLRKRRPQGGKSKILIADPAAPAVLESPVLSGWDNTSMPPCLLSRALS